MDTEKQTKAEEFELELMELEGKYQEGPEALPIDEIISAYELRLHAVREEKQSAEDDGA